VARAWEDPLPRAHVGQEHGGRCGRAVEVAVILGCGFLSFLSPLPPPPARISDNEGQRHALREAAWRRSSPPISQTGALRLGPCPPAETVRRGPCGQKQSRPPFPGPNPLGRPLGFCPAPVPRGSAHVFSRGASRAAFQGPQLVLGWGRGGGRNPRARRPHHLAGSLRAPGRESGSGRP
jgi:hypothetical protein